MSVRVKIPTQLRTLTGGQAELSVDGASDLRELLGKIKTEHPDLTERLLDENGEIRRFVNIYVGEEDVRFLDGLNTNLESGALVSILPAVAGG
ncbi:MAG TPA: MoaD/ThiS family protein [Actinomycetota bacterium]|nr:MoaD/ThiS family protein [Actinomycetota bacterium]